MIPNGLENQRYADEDFLGLRASLSDAERDELERIEIWIEKNVRPIADDYWVSGEFPVQLIPGIASLDIISTVRRKGWSRLLAGLVTAAFHRVDASVGTLLSGHDGLFTRSIELLASEAQQAEWLPDIYALRKLGVFAITEAEAGSDVARGLSTTAQFRDGLWHLNGQKEWIGNALYADWVLVWAKDVADDNVKAFLIEGSASGMNYQVMPDKMALRGVQNCEITIDDVVVPESRRLANATSFKATNRVFKEARVVAAWQAVGIQLGVLDAVRAHVLKRQQFGVPLAKFQLVQQQLAEILANVVSSEALLLALLDLEKRGGDHNEHSALVKARVTKLMRESVALARGLFGGNGILVRKGVGKFFCDAEAIYTYEGTYEINSLIVGRSLTGVSAFV